MLLFVLDSDVTLQGTAVAMFVIQLVFVVCFVLGQYWSLASGKTELARLSKPDERAWSLPRDR